MYINAPFAPLASFLERTLIMHIKLKDPVNGTFYKYVIITNIELMCVLWTTKNFSWVAKVFLLVNKRGFMR